MRLLVIAEHDHRLLSEATRRAVTAALQIGPAVDVLVAGSQCQPIVEQIAALQGVAQVRVADAAHYAIPMTEDMADLIVVQSAGYSHVLAAASSFGKRVLPRVAALLDVEQISEVCGVLSPDTFVRPIHAGNALATVRASEAVNVLTIRASAFAPAGDGGRATVEPIATVASRGLCEVLRREMTSSQRPSLGSARVVVAGGRGLGSAENFDTVLTPLADRLGAALGASYGAVSAGYVANDLQVGQTGTIVAPELYIAVGISGAIQHLAGMKDSRIIVAINKDPEAPIFQVADYAVVGDLFEVVPALVRALA